MNGRWGNIASSAPIQFISSALALSVLGAANAGYLVWQHYQKKPMVCPLNHNCSVVTESKWSRIFFIRNEVLGLLFFIGAFTGLVASLFIAELTDKIYFLLFLTSAGGVLFSAFLVYLQKYVIKDYCFYCLVSAVITLLLCLNMGLLTF